MNITESRNHIIKAIQINKSGIVSKWLMKKASFKRLILIISMFGTP